MSDRQSCQFEDSCGKTEEYFKIEQLLVVWSSKMGVRGSGVRAVKVEAERQQENLE